MKIQKHSQSPVLRTLNKAPEAPRSPDGFTPTPEGPNEPRTSWFHRSTGAIAGAAVLATAGTVLLTPLGNGMGGDGLIYPIAGMLIGGTVGLVTGALGAGAAHSTEEKTSLYHRATGAVSGALLGAIGGAFVVGPMGNGLGGDGLIYAAAGLAGGGALGAVTGTLLAGRFPDRS
ncbi:MAG: hypothetical protein KIS61_14175 [Candidatus Eremiobacteraeota bacterium]|nr:hypothetical protein [Candidatus Eremiobacteraeota bacterium]